MKSLMLFVREVLLDMEDWCRISTIRDYKTVTDRFEHEGLSFLTITLPNFGKDLQKGLDQGFVSHDQFTGFRFTGGLPRFLGGFLDLVFDRSSGRLLDDPDTTAIWALRQFSLMFAKINLECSEERIKKARAAFIKCEQDLRDSDRLLESTGQSLIAQFERLSRTLFADLFSRVDLMVYEGEIIGRHGPGRTAERHSPSEKWYQSEWTSRLEKVFPHWEHLISSPSYLDRLTAVKILEPGDERPVRVVEVPKTLKTPRIIAIEPTCMQFMQQGLLTALVQGIEEEPDKLLSSLLGWHSQIPNQELARKGSLTGALATLDLSEASDRVSNQHVRRLLANHPWLSAGVDACRSRKADVQGHGTIRLAKFASMGSALTFPMESFVFTTLVFVGIERELNRPLTRKDISSFVGKVRIYGDDIIVPVDYVQSVVRVLEAFGLQVNSGKSYWNGKFRESCGKDYYGGDDVSITRLRSLFPAQRTEVPEIISTIETRNQLYSAGMWRSTRYIDELLERISINLPMVLDTSRGLGRRSYLGFATQRYCDKLHRPLVKAYVVVPRPPRNEVDDYAALLKCLSVSSHVEIGLTDPAYLDPRHLERSGRPVAVDIKQRWVSPV